MYSHSAVHYTVVMPTILTGTATDLQLGDFLISHTLKGILYPTDKTIIEIPEDQDGFTVVRFPSWSGLELRSDAPVTFRRG